MKLWQYLKFKFGHLYLVTPLNVVVDSRRLGPRKTVMPDRTEWCWARRWALVADIPVV